MFELTYVKTTTNFPFKVISTIECDKFSSLAAAMVKVRELKAKPTQEINSIFLVNDKKEFVILNGKEF